MVRTFYRIGTATSEGLWYDKKGQFTGLIHNEFDFCANNKLEMPFDEKLIGWLSVADSLEHLYQWFTREDIIKLQKEGFAILEYKAIDYKFYEQFKHNVINQDTSILVGTLKITN